VLAGQYGETEVDEEDQRDGSVKVIRQESGFETADGGVQDDYGYISYDRELCLRRQKVLTACG